MYFPRFEYWHSGASVLAVLGFVFTMAVALYSLKLQQPGRLLRALIWVAVVFTLYLWWQTAKLEEAKDKPTRDYVYFVPWRIVGEEIQFRTWASGPIPIVRVFASRTENYVNTDDPDYVAKGKKKALEMVKDGLNASDFTLPPGDWTLDIDQAHRSGDVSQQLIIAIADGKIVCRTLVKRKLDGEVLFPPPIPQPSGQHPLNPTACQ